MKNKAALDIYYIKKTFELAKKGNYTTHPNPRVGALVVKNNTIIGKGYHKNPGSSHAEQIAIKNAGSNCRGSTLYVNLEPCCHFGKTPPCLDLIIRSKIKRVVISSIDPNPLVNGKSITQLKHAGIEVKIGICNDDAIEINKGFYSKFLNKKPFVVVKSGISLDGKIALHNGESKWITSSLSRSDVQKERALTSMILTTSETILADNPRLTVREVGLKKKIFKQPDLALLDSNLRISPKSKIFSDSSRKIYLFTSKKSKEKSTVSFKPNVQIISLPCRNQKLDMIKCFEILANQGVNDILVESGSTLISSLFKHSLVDELLLYISPKILGNTSTNFSGIDYIQKLSKKIKLKISDMIPIGNNLKVRLSK
ncbi:MAG: bifunctional diaminohydroxyphosphoribosylaminopyrimidine deaminase/5-amino-6-(5-phosphoribosylamino)uracil reductase RibD [Pelagibacterales bacterium]|nr:bifunctional diaminohydroxyphosphoribosylaminopyrimidine deaminase/5-amino-6-(5-phosphoribosylamino)uracil reductase RibD [Pelagibacterales bacterium]